jgi:predicted O-linked N-acetylglucosamine transferase (SPINDLY family)
MNITSHEICWRPELSDAIEQKNYSLAVNVYEREIESNPGEISNFFYLGLAYLLNGEEDLAQMTWFSAISENEATEIDSYCQLSYILNREACRQSNNLNHQESWIIRQHLREFEPSDVINHLELILVSIKLNLFSPHLLNEWQTLEVLRSEYHNLKLDEDLFQLVVDSILEYDIPESIEITSFLSQIMCNTERCVTILLEKVKDIKLRKPEFAGRISKICLELMPENLAVIQAAYSCYAVTPNHKEAIRLAELFLKKCATTAWKLIAIYALTREKTRGGDWENFEIIMLDYKALMYEIVQQGLLEENLAIPMVIMPCSLQYYQDNLKENRYLQNYFSRIFQDSIVKHFLLNNADESNSSTKTNFSYLFKKKSIRKKSKLKIGFLVSKLKVHSVGWLSRWLFHYYEREQFDFLIYMINQLPGDLFTQDWFESKVSQCRYFWEGDNQKVAESIYADEIDILIDLDSTTSCDACVILALKPAPIQATWLGYDASGVPAIDYFIVDPYLLPADAQDFYHEKLWRLPQTYLAVDGFEIEVPTVSRQELDIPDDAIIYLSAQTGQKRNPENVRLQLKIVKSVPNGYLLIKGLGDGGAIQDLFYRLAQEEGVELERLRFLKLDENEYVHRANLQIADVILDTYPYNGATTTLEALWVGVPIVTRLGQQCAARNSYTFLTQVGITDGIATTDEEYVEWGIRFGQDTQLRQKMNSQLKQSRHTSPLWNTKQFVRDMEAAFQGMWEIYIQNASEKSTT